MSAGARDALRLLVLDAYPRDGREQLRAAGCTLAGELYTRMLARLAPDAVVDVAYPADPDFDLPRGAALGGYDGIAWTGSSLFITREDARVTRQVELARAALRAGMPSFGSCWAAQVGAVAAGGACTANPRGREFGLARKIELSRAGREHRLYAGKPRVFDAFTSHADEVTRLPEEAALLASNAFTRVQALAIDSERSSFWAVQYHPEYDLHEVARLCVVRAESLVEQGNFRDMDEAHAYVADLEALHGDPSRSDIAWRLGIDTDVTDPDVRQVEVRNWIEHVVRPRARR